MKIKTRCWILSVGLVTLAFSLQPIAVDAGELQFEVSLPKKDWLVGEPVVLHVEFLNNSQTNQLVPGQLALGFGMTDYQVSKDGEAFHSLGSLLPVERKLQFITLAPGDSISHEEILAYDISTDNLAFSSPGDYFIRVDCQKQNSSIVKIHLKESESEDDRRGAEVMRSSSVLMAITPFGRTTQDAIKSLKKCADSKSTFTPYAAFFLGVAETNKTNALALLDKADVAGFPLQSRAVYEKARINLELGEKVKANELFQRITNEFPNSAATSDVKRKKLLESSQP